MVLPKNGRINCEYDSYIRNMEGGIFGGEADRREGNAMPRIATPASIEAAPAASQPMLHAVEEQLGVVPNLFRLVSNSPAALEGYLSLSGALARGRLPAPTRERIALAVAEINGCSYCLSAHTYLGKNLAKLDDAEMVANRGGGSNDPKAAAAVRFGAKVARDRGRIGDEDAPSGSQATIMRRSSRSSSMSLSMSGPTMSMRLPGRRSTFRSFLPAGQPEFSNREPIARSSHGRKPPAAPAIHRRDRRTEGTHGGGCLELP
jgi:AhpD family alkylhydroperoxidase